jgi:UPF0271 protein
VTEPDRRPIDLNADVGESFGPWPMGDDERLIPLVSSVNVACGAHAGDPSTIVRTIRLAAATGARIGAHPGYPDLAGFGRRELDMTAEELRASIIVQVGAVATVARSEGLPLHHVKPHGALYNRMARDRDLADTVALAVRDGAGTNVALLVLAGSVAVEAGRAAGLPILEEAFADRRYEADGSLRSRRLDGALLGPAEAAEQAVAIARDGTVAATGGPRLAVRADTICVHGDSPGAVDVARAVRSALEAVGFVVGLGRDR